MKKRTDKMTSFETRLLGRLTKARETIESSASRQQLRSKVTISKVSGDIQPREVTASDVKQIRKALGVSQAVLAAFIQTPVRTLQEWEQGRLPVSGCAKRLLRDMLETPSHWQSNFKKSMRPQQA